jgi:hypothetical protein
LPGEVVVAAQPALEPGDDAELELGLYTFLIE